MEGVAGHWTIYELLWLIWVRVWSGHMPSGEALQDLGGGVHVNDLFGFLCLLLWLACCIVTLVLCMCYAA